MIHVHLTQEEYETLVHILEDYLSDLRMEIADTDRKDFRDMLKHRKAIMMTVLESLERAGELSQIEA